MPRNSGPATVTPTSQPNVGQDPPGSRRGPVSPPLSGPVLAERRPLTEGRTRTSGWWLPRHARACLLSQRWSHRLKHEGGGAVLEELRGLDLSGRPSAREVWQETLTYFTNQVHRMDYPRYRACGWQIGSGPVESGCKTVVGQRLKCAGMRWGEPGSEGVCQLRALFWSEPGQWDAFWAGHRRVA